MAGKLALRLMVPCRQACNLRKHSQNTSLCPFVPELSLSSPGPLLGPGPQPSRWAFVFDVNCALGHFGSCAAGALGWACVRDTVSTGWAQQLLTAPPTPPPPAPLGDSLVCCQGKGGKLAWEERFAHNTGWGLKVDMLVQAQDSSWRLASVSGSGCRAPPSGRGLPGSIS